MISVRSQFISREWLFAWHCVANAPAHRPLIAPAGRVSVVDMGKIFCLSLLNFLQSNAADANYIHWLYLKPANVWFGGKMSSFFLLSVLCFLIGTFGFVIRANPKRWRRIYQTYFEHARKRHINRNKSIDEAIPAPVLRISMFCFMLGVVFALLSIKLDNPGGDQQEAGEGEDVAADEVAEQIIEDALRRAEDVPLYNEADY